MSSKRYKTAKRRPDFGTAKYIVTLLNQIDCLAAVFLRKCNALDIMIAEKEGASAFLEEGCWLSVTDLAKYQRKLSHH